MLKEFYIPSVDDKFRLLFAAQGLLRDLTAEELRRDDPEADCDFSDTYEKVNYAVYRSNCGKMLVCTSYAYENGNDELPTIDGMLDFAKVYADEMRENKHLILHISQLSGTTPDSTLIYDEKFYNKLKKISKDSIVGAIYNYKKAAYKKSRDGGSYKYDMIENGVYSRL